MLIKWVPSQDQSRLKLRPLGLSGLFLFYAIIATFFFGCEEPDKIPPQIVITSPADGRIVSEMVRVTCVATDNVALKGLELWLDDSDTGLRATTEPYAFLFNSIPLEDGSSHHFIVRAYDASDNLGESDPVNFTVDQSMAIPAGAFLYPIELDDSSYCIKWSANESLDFGSYELYESLDPLMNDSERIFATSSVEDTLVDILRDQHGLYYYYQVVIQDTLGLSSRSNIETYFRTPNFRVSFGGRSMDEAFSVCETIDGGFAFTGETDSYGNEYGELWIGKTNAFGSQLWIHDYALGSHGEGYSIIETVDGGLVVVGQTSEYTGNGSDVWVLKTDSQGATVWSLSYGGTAYEEGRSIFQTNEGGFIICGYTTSMGAGSADVYLLKISSTGELEWETSFGGENWDTGRFVKQTAEGGYIVIASTESYGNGNMDAWLIKTSSDGTEEWNAPHGGTWNGGNVRDYVYSGDVCSDGGYVICGETTVSGLSVAYLAKTNAQGVLEWWQNYGYDKGDYAHAVRQTPDGGFILGGGSQSVDTGKSQALIIKADPQGQAEWHRVFGGIESSAALRGLATTSWGGYILAGYTSHYLSSNRNALLIRTDAQGEIE